VQIEFEIDPVKLAQHPAGEVDRGIEGRGDQKPGAQGSVWAVRRFWAAF
jgi:hypothetical protein